MRNLTQTIQQITYGFLPLVVTKHELNLENKMTSQSDVVNNKEYEVKSSFISFEIMKIYRQDFRCPNTMATQNESC